VIFLVLVIDMFGRTRVYKIFEDTGEMVQKSTEKVYVLTLQAVGKFDNSLVVEAQSQPIDSVNLSQSKTQKIDAGHGR
jgi:fructose 1,6-bisphosphatase